MQSGRVVTTFGYQACPYLCRRIHTSLKMASSSAISPADVADKAIIYEKVCKMLDILLDFLIKLNFYSFCLFLFFAFFLIV